MHRNAADVVAHQLDFARVQPAADLDREFGRGSADRERASDPSGRSIEGRQEIVASRVDFATAETVKLLTDHGAELVEEITPRPVSELRRTLRRRHDASEQRAGEDPVG